MKFIRVIIFSALAIALLTCTLHAQSIPQYTFFDSSNQQVKPLNVARGKMLLILWDANDQNSRLALLKMKTIATKLRALSFTIVAVETSGASLSGRNWFAKARIPFHFFYEKRIGKRLSKRYRGKAMPVFLLVDRVGRVGKAFFGYKTGDEYKLLSLCENFSPDLP